MRKFLRNLGLGTVLLAAAPYEAAFAEQPNLGLYAKCYMDAAHTYGRDPLLYFSIAQVESSGCKNLVGRNTDGSRDIGCMAINSSQFPFLEKYGITEDRLLHDPCLNIHVGAWILETKIQKYGPTWQAVGAYNAACTKLKGDACITARYSYIAKVWGAYQKQIARYGGSNAPVLPEHRVELRISGD